MADTTNSRNEDSGEINASMNNSPIKEHHNLPPRPPVPTFTPEQAAIIRRLSQPTLVLTPGINKFVNKWIF